MKIYHRGWRLLGWLIWGVAVSLGLVDVGMMIRDREPWWIVLLMLIFPMGGTLIAFPILYWYPRVDLQPQGICVKWWFRTRFYSWNAICQAGVSCFVPRGYYINRLTLVPDGCSKRKYRDWLFHLRNFGKLIYIPYTPQTRNFVIAHYGPLDFNLADGAFEGSVVTDK